MNPILIGLANVIAPGLGYLILRKRQVFGFFLLLNSALTYVWTFLYPDVATPSMIGLHEFKSLLGIIAVASFMVAFYYDAYSLAKNG